MAHRWERGLRIGAPQSMEREEGVVANRTSACRGVRHARLQPALGDGKETGRFARGKDFVKAEHAAVAAVALGAMDRERGPETAAVGRVCRGRNDVLAHGNGGLWNLDQSGSQARIDLREHQGTRWAAARQTNWATRVAKGGLLRATGRRSAGAADATLSVGVAATLSSIPKLNFKTNLYYFWF